jgi:hypothetical protein
MKSLKKKFMNELDKILIDRLVELEEEPSAGHFQRFSERLNKRERIGRLNLSFLRVAAVVVFFMLSANLLVYLKVHRTEVQLSSTQKKEMKEAGYYYTSLINNDISEIEKMAKEGIGSEKEVLQVKKELSEMDSLFLNLKKDYESNPTDERILNAMIEYYQAKLDIVNTIKSDLENVKQQKVNYHENLKS